MNNTASGLVCAITLLLSHMFLETKATRLIDSLEIASVKFLNSVVELRGDSSSGESAVAANRPATPARGTA
jgi:biopolymer transport protein ExbB/TolQ